MIIRDSFLILCEKHDFSHSHMYKEVLPSSAYKVVVEPITMLAQLQRLCKRYGVYKVICSQDSLLKKLIRTRRENLPHDMEFSSNDYRGAYFQLFEDTDTPIQVLVLPPCRHLYMDGMPWLFRRWIQKLTNPNFPEFPMLDYAEIVAENFDAFHALANKAVMIAVDVETDLKIVDPKHVDHPAAKGMFFWGYTKKDIKKQHLLPLCPVITHVSYTLLLQYPNGQFYSKTGVIVVDSLYAITCMRILNATKPPKVLQNGGYDCSYFARYQAPLHNYLADTFIMMHAWVVELSRDLGFITSLFDKNYIDWKDESDIDKVAYNAKDTHNTLWSFVYMLMQVPQYAIDNYAENFRMQFPCITCGLEGFKVDEEERERLKKEREASFNKDLKRLRGIIHPDFNPNSPKQVLHMFKGFGVKSIKSTDAKSLRDFREKQALFDHIGGLIKSVREDRKAVSTYFKAPIFDGRILYELNPGGTDSGRMASKASNFWCGNQIQNQPLYAKSMYIADEGYELNSADNGQSETRCTAYMSEDENLIEIVEAPGDFHRKNASKFFGLSVEEITTEIRNVGKRINHGANYNMGDRVLLDTMGRKAVAQAARLLKFPASLGLLSICNKLLSIFDAAYPDVRGKYYREVIQEIQLTGMLRGPTGWVRRCFGNPTKNKPSLNTYVAHGPQSLSVKIINNAFFDAWLQYQLIENVVRFKAQVHDELIWQCKPEHTEYTAKKIGALMQRPTVVRGRVMVIPNDPKLHGKTWLELKD